MALSVAARSSLSSSSDDESYLLKPSRSWSLMVGVPLVFSEPLSLSSWALTYTFGGVLSFGCLGLVADTLPVDEDDILRDGVLFEPLLRCTGALLPDVLRFPTGAMVQQQMVGL